MAFSLRNPVLSAAIAAAAILVTACAPSRPHTPWSAAENAARLANKQCQEKYGLKPFAPDDHEAEYMEGRWVWGGEGSLHVDGFSAEVSFAPDGRKARIDVHRDEAYGNPDGL